MNINELPTYDASDNPTRCCPRFNTKGWDRRELHFRDKLFARATAHSVFHFPIDMGQMFKRTFDAIEAADARSNEDFIVMSRDLSAWSSEHYFSVTKEVPGLEMVRMSGDFLTKVLEGPFSDAPKWEKAVAAYVGEHGRSVDKIFFFYTTCPSCGKAYGKNYVVALAQVQ
jgi:hypothetical protein